MKLWKIFIVFVLFVSTLNINSAQAKKFSLVENTDTTTTLDVQSSAGSISFSGVTSPNATVSFVEGNQIVGTTQANSLGVFNKVLSGLSPTIHNIGIYATDTDLVNTIITIYSVNVEPGLTVFLSGIILPPSFSLDADTVKRPAELLGRGRALRNADLQVFISGSNDSLTLPVKTDNLGDWSVNLNPKLHLGQKTASVLALDGLGGQSSLSQSLDFTVIRSSDLNVDNLVNLADFDIFIKSYKKVPIPDVISDINDNSVVDLTDFSIMLADWSK